MAYFALLHLILTLEQIEVNFLSMYEFNMNFTYYTI